MFGVHGFWCTLFGVGKNPFQKEKKKVEPRRDGKHGSMDAASTARRVKDEPGKKRWRKIPGEERRECG